MIQQAENGRISGQECLCGAVVAHLAGSEQRCAADGVRQAQVGLCPDQKLDHLHVIVVYGGVERSAATEGAGERRRGKGVSSERQL